MKKKQSNIMTKARIQPFCNKKYYKSWLLQR